MSSPTVADALALATRAHARQKDKAGEDYIHHPRRVMDAVEGDDAKIVAVLHDVLEDTGATREELRAKGYSARIVEAIEALTKLPDEKGSDEGYMRFIQRAAQNPLARIVKIADLSDNMNLERIAEPTDKDRARIRRYEKARQFLQAGE